MVRRLTDERPVSLGDAIIDQAGLDSKGQKGCITPR